MLISHSQEPLSRPKPISVPLKNFKLGTLYSAAGYVLQLLQLGFEFLYNFTVNSLYYKPKKSRKTYRISCTVHGYYASIDSECQVCGLLSISEASLRMAMAKVAVRSCSALFSRMNNCRKTSACFLHSNSLSSPTQSMMGRLLRLEIRPGGNAGYRICCMSSNSGSGGRISARLMQMQQVLEEAESRATYANESIPKVTLDHVTVGFARSGGPGGQNVNKVNTKVDMRFNVMAAGWLPLRVRERIVQMEKNRINSEGDLVISSTRTRTQKGNIDDALEKIQAIIDAAAYVPPAPSDEKKKKIKKLAEIDEQKRLQTKKVHSLKKAGRKNKGSWD